MIAAGCALLTRQGPRREIDKSLPDQASAGIVECDALLASLPTQE